MIVEAVKTPVSSMVLVFVASIIGSFASVLLKASSGRLQFTIPALLTNWKLIGGAMTYLVSSVFFVWGVKNGELSVLYPLVSLGYIWTMVWSKLFFGEPITRAKMSGVALILVGIVLLGFANR
ncbi:MAG: EamA family transporter [Bryobacteraceae bacterium]